MFAERFTVPIDQPVPAVSQAFVACPIVVANNSSPQGAIGEIYRIAYERAWELHKPSRWAPLYDVCLN